MELWLLIIGMGLITFVLRLALIVAVDRVAIPLLVQEGLKYVPPAVLSAIIFTELLRPEGYLDLTAGNERLLAGVVAGTVAWLTRNVLLTIVAGMAILWLLLWL